MCEHCADRPELTICPQCRVPLQDRMSRNRALEELARRTFPGEAEDEAGPRRGGGRGRALQARGAPSNRSRASRFRFVQNQGDLLDRTINTYFVDYSNDVWDNSDDGDGDN